MTANATAPKAQHADFNTPLRPLPRIIFASRWLQLPL